MKSCKFVLKKIFKKNFRITKIPKNEYTKKNSRIPPIDEYWNHLVSKTAVIN